MTEQQQGTTEGHVWVYIEGEKREIPINEWRHVLVIDFVGYHHTHDIETCWAYKRIAQ